MKKIRLDDYLFRNGFCNSLDKAKKEIVTGWVKVNGETVRDPLRKISENENILISRPGGDFVSRGGYKLQHALDTFNISVKDKVIADIGSSTGGFTDCLLKNGAKRVYSIDVGYGILAYSLRTDPRVIVKERTNIRSLDRDDFEGKIDFLTIDLSFVSVLELTDYIKETFSPVLGILLIKPQFEAKAHEHKKGIVKEKEHHINILEKVIKSLNSGGFEFNNLCYSPIKGHAGNIEFLLFFSVSNNASADLPADIDSIIEKVIVEAYKNLL
ncbi:MAG: TlyA family RNA methyltransferase [Spirochaetes bacterium]|nr:TlyA family RNA methyltransferase [Spirochaetota bacterium]